MPGTSVPVDASSASERATTRANEDNEDNADNDKDDNKPGFAILSFEEGTVALGTKKTLFHPEALFGCSEELSNLIDALLWFKPAQDQLFSYVGDVVASFDDLVRDLTDEGLGDNTPETFSEKVKSELKQILNDTSKPLPGPDSCPIATYVILLDAPDDLVAVQRIVDGPPDRGADFLYNPMCNPMCSAVQMNAKEVFDFLSGRGAIDCEATAGPSRGCTPLTIAVQCRRSAMVQKLLDAQADVNRVCTSRPHTALHAASLTGDPRLVARLLAQGADYHATRKGVPKSERPLLMRCMKQGYTDVVLRLVDAGAWFESSQSISQPRDVLFQAVRHDDAAVVDKLLDVMEKRKKKSDASKERYCPLFYHLNLGIALRSAIDWGGRHSVVEMLLNARANAGTRDPRTGLTPLHRACIRSDVRIVRLLCRSCGVQELEDVIIALLSVHLKYLFEQTNAPNVREFEQCLATDVFAAAARACRWHSLTKRDAESDAVRHYLDQDFYDTYVRACQRLRPEAVDRIRTSVRYRHRTEDDVKESFADNVASSRWRPRPRPA